MNIIKKFSFHRKQINKLTEQIKSLEQENRALEQENTSLHRVNDSYRQKVMELQHDHDDAMKKYFAGLSEIKEMRQKYQTTISAVNKSKEEYADKMNVLLQRLRKQNAK